VSWRRSLAKFLRPQIVRKYASGAGIDIQAKHPATTIDLLGEFYGDKIHYDEVRHLYVGLMSNSPNNIGDQLYTKLRSDLVGGFADGGDNEKMLFNTLFRTVVATRRATAKCEELFRGEDYAEPFLRVFHERKPQYRMFLAIVALAAMLRIDVSARLDDGEKELERMLDFFCRALDLLETNERDFIRAYVKAFNAFAQEARSSSGDDSKIKQYLSSLLKRGFRTTYLSVAMSIDSDRKIANL
jgi:hypothetical protein